MKSTTYLDSSMWKPLFIVGCDRSGTSLLSAVLEAKFQIAAPLEPHFIPYFSKMLFLWGDLSNERNRIRLISAIDDFLLIWVPQNNRRRDPHKVQSATLLGVREQFPAIAVESASFGEIITGIFDRYAQFKGKERWVDPSSFYDVTPLNLWERHLPDLRVIHIIRDGRDVVLSWMKSWFHPVNFADAAYRWAAHVEEKCRWGMSHPDQYLEVRFEELLTQTEDIISRIAAFLQVKPKPGLLDLKESKAARVLSEGGTHELLGTRIIQKSNMYKWKRQMPEADQQLFEYVAGSVLTACRYERRFENLTVSQQGCLRSKIIGSRLQHFLSRRYCLNKIKTALPVMIFCTRLLGISLPKLLTMGKAK